jgi:hypothetical protein
MEEKSTATTEKPSYEQLERELAGIKSMNTQLIAQLQQVNLGNLFKRLDYLFKVLETKDAFTNSEFVTKCAKEIEGHLTLNEEGEGE